MMTVHNDRLALYLCLGLPVSDGVQMTVINLLGNMGHGGIIEIAWGTHPHFRVGIY
jgi:hypothetical protein